MSTEQSSTGASLRPFLAELRPGQPLQHKSLTLVPLQGQMPQHVDYLLAADAMAVGTLTITEVSSGGVVSELRAVSTADKPILLLDGEELLGAKQNRVANTTLLLPAKSTTMLPVSCVEAHR